MKEFPFRVIDSQRRTIILTRERWSHIADRHGELVGLRKEILRTIKDPEEIIKQEGRDDTYHYFLSTDKLEYNKYICVVINTEEEFLVTAYPTSQKKV